MCRIDIVNIKYTMYHILVCDREENNSCAQVKTCIYCVLYHQNPLLLWVYLDRFALTVITFTQYTYRFLLHNHFHDDDFTKRKESKKIFTHKKKILFQLMNQFIRTTTTSSLTNNKMVMKWDS